MIVVAKNNFELLEFPLVVGKRLSLSQVYAREQFRLNFA